ncbi:MAG: XF1762 family protein [Patescibacteria group bacterium]|jgi:hypothetical protein
MKSVPLTLREANEYVRQFHRHNAPVRGCRFAIGAELAGKLVGVAIAGRPVARLLDNGKTLEILRVCTDGTRNANSFLYGKVRQIAQIMGYEKVITYTLQTESGSSLKAVGAKIDALTSPVTWNRPNRKRIEQAIYQQNKIRWLI